MLLKHNDAFLFIILTCPSCPSYINFPPLSLSHFNQSVRRLFHYTLFIYLFLILPSHPDIINKGNIRRGKVIWRFLFDLPAMALSTASPSHLFSSCAFLFFSWWFFFCPLTGLFLPLLLTPCSQFINSCVLPLPPNNNIWTSLFSPFAVSHLLPSCFVYPLRHLFLKKIFHPSTERFPPSNNFVDLCSSLSVNINECEVEEQV